MRRVEALQAKSWYYTSALVVAGLGVGLYFLLSFKVALVVDGVCGVLMLALLIKGYLKVRRLTSTHNLTHSRARGLDPPGTWRRPASD